jgi:hypothetical protein
LTVPSSVRSRAGLGADAHGRDHAPVVMPREEGGPAIAGVLSGRLEPGGRLPVQIPRSPGGQPGTYLQPPLGAEHSGTTNLDPTPLFPFGHGCSYTTFEVSDLQISSQEIPTDGQFTASVQIRNTGSRPGQEVIQLYLHDVLASVARPVKQLIGFARVHLDAGQAQEVSFTVHADRTAYTDRELQRIVEPGDIEVLIGTSATHLPHRAQIRLTGPMRVVGQNAWIRPAARPCTSAKSGSCRSLVPEITRPTPLSRASRSMAAIASAAYVLSISWHSTSISGAGLLPAARRLYSLSVSDLWNLASAIVDVGRGTVLFVNGGSGARPNPKVVGSHFTTVSEYRTYVQAHPSWVTRLALGLTDSACTVCATVPALPGMVPGPSPWPLGSGERPPN